MASSKLKPKDALITCHLRRESLSAQPEELVRQRLLEVMLEQLGYPRGHLAVEKALKKFPHLASKGLSVPDRRVDIVCFAKGINKEYDLYPLLLVECKAVKLTPKVLQQIAGYNHYVGAPFITIANGNEVHTGWHDANAGCYRFIGFLPRYQDLLEKVALS